MKYKYRVGQKIRVLKTNANCAQVRKGQIFTIRSIDADGINVEPTDRHFGWYFSFENIEPVKRDRPAKKMAKPKKLVDVGKTGSFTYTERATMEEMQLPDWKVSRTAKPKAEPKAGQYEMQTYSWVKTTKKERLIKRIQGLIMELGLEVYLEHHNKEVEGR